MRAKVTTESGQRYDFIMLNGRVYFCRGVNSIGEVVFMNEPIEVGKPIEIKFIKEGLNVEESLKSTPVKDISVYLK